MDRACSICVVLCVLVAGADSLAKPPDRPLIFSVNPVGNGPAVGANHKGSDFVRYDELLFQRISEAGSRSARVLASWREVEAEKGKWDWSNLDREIGLCAKYRVEPVVLICNIPAWVSPTGKPAHDHPPKDENAADFSTFITKMAERCKGKAKYYEFWNEQNGCSWINEGCDNAQMAHTYLPWLQRTYKAIKAVDPTAQVAIGGLDDVDGYAPIFVEQCYKLRAEQYKDEKFWDAIAEHPYDKRAVDPATAMTAKLDAIRAIARKHGDTAVSIWITEYGWNVQESGLDAQTRGTEAFLESFGRPDQKDLLIAQQLAIADFEPVHAGYGLCDLNLRPRPAFQAFQRQARPATPFPLSLEFGVQADGTPVVKGALVSLTQEQDPPVLVEVLDEQGKRLLSEKTDPHVVSVVVKNAPQEDPLLAVISELNGDKPGTAISRLPIIAPKGLLPNPGFESLFRAGIPWAWTITGSSICRDGGGLGKQYCHGGEHSLILAQLDSSPRRLFDDQIDVPVRVAQGARLQVRWSARYFAPDNKQAFVLMSASLRMPEGDESPRPSGKPIGQHWTEQTADCTAPCDSPVLRLHVVSENLAKGQWLVAIDDISVTPLRQ
jgi:hypothetical protein